MFSVPVDQITFLVAAVAGGGVLSGLMAGLFGIGGGAVIVPVLYEVFRVLGVPEDVRMQLCIGTSFAIIVPTTFRSFFAHRKKTAGFDDLIRSWALPATVGVLSGLAVASIAPAGVFKAAFAAVTGVISVKLLFARDSWRIADDLPHGPLLWPFGYLIGFASSLMGVSGGSVTNVIMMLYSKSIHVSIAVAAGVGVPIAIAGTVGYMLIGLPHAAEMPPFSIGYVSLVGVVVMAPLSSWVAGLGAVLAHRIPRRRLEILLGLYLAAVSLRFLFAA